jgi:hypothetical protein
MSIIHASLDFRPKVACFPSSLKTDSKIIARSCNSRGLASILPMGNAMVRGFYRTGHFEEPQSDATRSEASV